MRSKEKRQKLTILLKDFLSEQVRTFTREYGEIPDIEYNRLDKAIKAARYINYKNKMRRKL